MATGKRGRTGIEMRILVPLAILAAVWVGFAMILPGELARPVSTPAPVPVAEYPSPRPVTGEGATVADRDIAAVPLQPDTTARSCLCLSQWLGKLTNDHPYAWEVSLIAGTIVDVQEAGDHQSVWVALAIRGNRLTRHDSGGGVLRNLDVSTTPLFNYEGLTAWVRFDQSVVVVRDDSAVGTAGLNALQPYLVVGASLPDVAIYPGDGGYPQYQATAEMTRLSARLLDDLLGQPNNRANQQFRFQSGIVRGLSQPPVATPAESQ